MYQSRDIWSGYTNISKCEFQSIVYYHGLRRPLHNDKVLNLSRRQNIPNAYASANRIAKYIKYNKVQAGIIFNHNNVKIMEFGKLLLLQAPKHLPTIPASPPGSSPAQKLKR